MTPPSRMSYRDFNAHIAAATLKPLGWAVRAGSSERAATRVTVLCEELDDLVWIRYRAPGCVALEVVARDELTNFVSYSPKES